MSAETLENIGERLFEKFIEIGAERERLARYQSGIQHCLFIGISDGHLFGFQPQSRLKSLEEQVEKLIELAGKVMGK